MNAYAHTLTLACTCSLGNPLLCPTHHAGAQKQPGIVNDEHRRDFYCRLVQSNLEAISDTLREVYGFPVPVTPGIIPMGGTPDTKSGIFCNIYTHPAYGDLDAD